MIPDALLSNARVEPCSPWPRHVLPAPDWTALAAAPLHLLGLWADTQQAHALFLDEADGVVLPVSVSIEAGIFPALSPHRPGAAWYERMVHDLWGHTAAGGVDSRPWLDHGTWAHAAPLATRAGPPPAREPPDFATDPDDTRMQWPIGPVAGGVGEAAHLRLILHGDRVMRAEARLGYTHKGTLALMRGKLPRIAARFAARLAGDSTVAHATAFARATEAALAVAAPPRAAILRAMMGEIERIAGHLDQLGSLALAACALDTHARCGRQREMLLRATETAFGHRLMMDCVVPGGVAADLVAPQVLLRAMGGIATELPALWRSFHGTALTARLTGTALAPLPAVLALSAGGVTGRASGRRWDARRLDPVYAGIGHVIPTGSGGDSAARASVRLTEIGESLRLTGRLIETLPDGPLTIALPMSSGEGIGCAESIHGDVWHWLRLDHGQIAAVFPRDPGWALWPLAETVLTGAPVEDVALVRCSLGLPVSGMDL